MICDLTYITYPSRVNKQKLREKDDNLALKFVEIFRNLHFELSFADALLHMPKFALMFKSLLNNKEKLFDLAATPVNENCSAVILKKLPEKLGDPGKFLIPCDFPEFDECLALADLDPHVPLILGRPFLRTERALIDVYGEELTLHVNDEAITFKVGQTLKYSYIDAESGGDFILEEIEACLTSKLIPPGIDDFDLDLEGHILLKEELLNNDPSLSPLPLKELNVEEIKTVKSSIDELPELELKGLPSHLKYAYLEGTDKLPMIIAKGLKDNEKEALLKVLKSHKRAIAWKITDVKGIDPRFCTHKILLEKDYKPTVQSQRWVNPKIHEVIKKEVIKLLDAGMIYSISDSPWASLIMRNVDLNTFPEKESDEFIKSSVEDLVPIPSESEDTSGSKSVCILPSCDDFSPIDVPEEKDSKDSYYSNRDEPDLLVTPLFDANKDECFDSGGDEINVLDCEDSYYDSEGDILYLESFLNDDLVYHDPSIPAMSVASILEGLTDKPPLEENDDLFDLESKNDDWKRILYNAHIDDLIAPDLESSRARGFFHSPLELQSFAYGNPIS
nr:DNA-directed DNA polymerase [Tanacetum cinerariifolium]